MAAFDQADALAAASVGRVFSETVTWRPMRKRGGGSYTQARFEPDPTRPVKELPAIVTWRPTVVDPGSNHSEVGGLPSFDCLVDIDQAAFAGGPEPVMNDQFTLHTPRVGNDRLQIARPPGDDGSSRIFFWCTVPQ